MKDVLKKKQKLDKWFGLEECWYGSQPDFKILENNP